MRCSWHTRAMFPRDARAYRRAGIDPASSWRLLEGHGLGVPAADRALKLRSTCQRPSSPRSRMDAGPSVPFHR